MTTGNSYMTDKTGNSYTTGITTNSVEITTASQVFLTIVNPNKVPLVDCDNVRQPEMALRPLKLEILKTMNSNGKCGVCGPRQLEETDLKRLRQRPTTGNENMDVSGPSLQFLVVVRCRNHLATLLSSSSSSKISNLLLEFRCYLS